MKTTPSIFALLVLLTAVAASGCGGSSDSTASTEASSSATTETTAETTTSDATSPDSSAQVRASLLAGIRSTLLGNGLPAGYTGCVIDKAQDEVTDAQIEELVKKYANGDAGAARAFGVTLGKECVAEGAGIDEFRASFVGSIRQSLAGSGLSPAYGACVLKKADTEISDDELSQILVSAVNDPAQAQVQGQAIGRRLGQACQAQGVKP